MTSEITRAEVCVTACADAWSGAGEVLAHAVGVIPSISARLARLTHEPDLVLSDGECFFVSDPPPIGKSASSGLGTIESWAPFRSIFEILNTGRRHSMMGASQIDRFGNQNISAIGDWQRPKRQLIGVRGAPGNTVNHRVDYWISRHTARVFVEKVDVVSGVGNDRARAHTGTSLRFHDLGVVVTNLAVLDYAEDGSVKVRSFHPGVTADEVRANTGFDIDVSTTTITRFPSTEELRLIREVIDPANLRDKEVRA
ncbi:CoA-transferase subunit beta [Rhodococcus sp. IEGM1428]|uniref:CoA-transferase subunit beta n=1 Tax=Rhodococcus sp. IEGM1428 TaxID=3392191 RepID=UPI003D0EB42A